MQPDAAISTALIIAEAVNNAIEHGFAGNRAGRITVGVERRTGDDLAITVHDDGTGLPAGFDPDQTTSLGLKIATSLAQGQRGRFRLEQRNGTCATLILPADLVA